MASGIRHLKKECNFVALPNVMGLRMLKRVLPLLILVLGLAFACKPLDEAADPNPAKALRFSVKGDSVMFDTVFTEQKTITLRVKVFNDNAGAITLSNVAFEAGAESPYTFHINGRPGPVVQNLTILGNDSAYVLVSGRLNPSRVDTPLVYQDFLKFTVQGRNDVQKILVIAKGQDAIYLDGATLKHDTTFKANKPIVIFNSILVDCTATLTIEAGTRIHMYQDSYFLVKGTLKVNGTYEKPVRFSGTRLEPYYSLIPGQWGYLAFFIPSKNNEIHHARIENGLRGIQLNVPNDLRPHVVDLKIDNTMIRNVSDVGLYGFGAKITGYNLVIADCGSSYIAGLRGGDYTFAHCSMAQSGNTPFNRKSPVMVFSDFFQQDANSTRYQSQPPTVRVFNSVVSGSLQDEFVLAAPSTGNAAIDTSYIVNNLFSGRRLATRPRRNTFYTSGAYPYFARPDLYDFRPDSTDPRDFVGIDEYRPSTITTYFAPYPSGSSIYKDFLNQDRINSPFYRGAYEKNQ